MMKQEYLKENPVVQGEPQSTNPHEPSSRFIGTTSLTNIFKSQTPGQNQPETTADVVKRVVKDAIAKKESQ